MRLIYFTGILGVLQYNFRFHAIKIFIIQAKISKGLEKGTHTKFQALFATSLDGDDRFTYYRGSYTIQQRQSLLWNLLLFLSETITSSVFCIANNLTSHSHGCSLDVLSDETQNSKCYKNVQKKRKRKLALSANNRDNVNAQYLYSRAVFIQTKF